MPSLCTSWWLVQPWKCIILPLFLFIFMEMYFKIKCSIMENPAIHLSINTSQFLLRMIPPLMILLLGVLKPSYRPYLFLQVQPCSCQLLKYICHTITNWSRSINRHQEPVYGGLALFEQSQQKPLALVYCVNAHENVIQLVSSISLISVNMRRILWLKAWSAECPFKKEIPSIHAIWWWTPLWGIPWHIFQSNQEKGIPIPQKQ